MRKLLIVGLLTLAIAGLVYSLRGKFRRVVVAPKPEQAEYEVIAENLQIPWEVAFLPNGEMLVTERPGRLLKIGQDKQVIEIN